jgi:hypothetical protein
MENWATEIKEILKTSTVDFSAQEKEKISYSYLINLLSRIEDKTVVADEELRSTIEYVVNELPRRRDGKLLYMKNHINEISNLKTYVDEKYDLMPKGKFRKRFLPLGISLGPAVGLLFGVAFGNIAVGLLLGVLCGGFAGIRYGNQLDKKAEMESRTL